MNEFSRKSLAAIGMMSALGYGFFFFYSTASYLELHIQAYVISILTILLYAATRVRTRHPDMQRILIVAFSLFITARYWFFRTFETLYYGSLPDLLAMSALYFAETYSIIIHALGMFVNVSPLEREIIPVDLDDPGLPTVDVFIPTYDEPEHIPEITATACTQLDYPQDKLNIFILDDGGTVERRNNPDPEKARQAQERHQKLKTLARSLGVHYLTRISNVHAKAGNLSHALACTCPELFSLAADNPKNLGDALPKTCGDLILVLDCDHVPSRDLLRNVVGHFQRDENLFLVQTPHFFINPDPVEKNLGTFLNNPSENEMFYRAVHQGLDFWNSSFFCGSGAILRRKHLAAAGGLAHESVTEDAETSLVLHSHGYRSIYVSKPMICGLSPTTFGDFVLQRIRWAQGMIQILVLKNPLFFPKVKWYQRICYLSSAMFWFFGLARFIFVVAPLGYLFLGLRVYNASLLQILAYAIPHLAASYILTNHLFGHVRHPFFSELYETVQSFFCIPAILKALFRPRSPKFRVTPKAKTLAADFLSPLAYPVYILFVLTVASLPVAYIRWFRHPMEHDAIIICLCWAVFNLLLLLLCLGIVWERRQMRRSHRINVDEEATVLLVSATSDLHRARILDVSMDGIRLLIKEDVRLSRKDRVNILAQDSYGNEYRLPVEVTRVEEDNGRLVLGCSFLVADEQTRKDIIGYVYGDSSRWQDFWDRNRRRRVSIWSGMIYLLGKGVEGGCRNIAGVLVPATKAMKRFGGMVWRRWKEET